MVEAAHIRTRGLGGDSEIRADSRAMQPELLLGPRRAIPLSLLAQIIPDKEPAGHQLDHQSPSPMMPAVLPDAEDVPAEASRSEADWSNRSRRQPVALAVPPQVALGAVDRLVTRH